MEHLKLFQNEKSAAFMGLSSVTVVFDFPGPLDERHVMRMVARTVRQQPCLAGRLISNQGEIEIAFKTSGVEGETDVPPAQCFQTIDSSAPLHQMARSLPDIASAFAAAVVPNGSSALDKDESLFRVTLVRHRAREGSPSTRTSLVVSMSHILGDGFTFFRVVDSLFPDSSSPQPHATQRLEFSRDRDFRAHVVRFLGEATVNFHWHWSSVVGVLLNRWANGKRCCAVFRLSAAYILKKKNEFESEVAGARVSSNDVLVSALAHDILRSSFVNLVVNLRPHIYDDAPQSLRSSAMGNYFGALVLAQRDVASPAAVRRAVLRYVSAPRDSGRVADSDLPTAFDRLRMRGTLLVSNWVSLGAAWPAIPDSDGRVLKCESMLPLMFRSATAGHNAIVFRMCPDAEDLAVAFLSHREFVEQLQRHPIVAEAVCPPGEI